MPDLYILYSPAVEIEFSGPGSITITKGNTKNIRYIFKVPPNLLNAENIFCRHFSCQCHLESSIDHVGLILMHILMILLNGFVGELLKQSADDEADDKNVKM